jgi:hypothetical protein
MALGDQQLSEIKSGGNVLKYFSLANPPAMMKQWTYIPSHVLTLVATEY